MNSETIIHSTHIPIYSVLGRAPHRRRSINLIWYIDPDNSAAEDTEMSISISIAEEAIQGWINLFGSLQEELTKVK